jgi:hypothetical protein
MAVKDYFLDAYVRRARLQPALLVALPAALAVLAWFPTDTTAAGAVWSLIAWSGGAMLAAQIARDRGKAREPKLFETWGGKPTTRALRHRDSTNRVLLERRHNKLRALLLGVHVPSAAEEAADPKAADDAYETCTVFLLEKTRNHDQFPLVFEANCDYGFRRNLWSMKPIALPVALASLGAIGVLWYERFASGGRPDLVPVVASIAALAIAVGWLFWFTPDWVKAAADAFAERLLGALENL